jgi:hypothetical protein
MKRAPMPEIPPDVSLPTVVPPLTVEQVNPFGALESPATRVLDGLADLLPSGIPATKKGIELVMLASGAVRHLTDTAERVIEAQAHLEERRVEIGVKIATAADKMSAIRGNIRLRDAVLPDQIAVAKETLRQQLRDIVGACAASAEAPARAAAEDEYERYQHADDEHSKAARIATMHASNGLTRATAEAPCIPYAALLYRNAIERTRGNHAAAVRETFLHLRAQLESGAVTDEVCRHAAEQLTERETNQRRAAGLGAVVDGLKGAAAGGGR